LDTVVVNDESIAASEELDAVSLEFEESRSQRVSTSPDEFIVIAMQNTVPACPE
jgi:hypothetical protein